MSLKTFLLEIDWRLRLFVSTSANRFVQLWESKTGHSDKNQSEKK